MKKFLMILAIILAVIATGAALVYFLVLQYPNLKEDPKEGKWYRVTTNEMKTSEGDPYRAFFKTGSKNKVLIYFAGGGVSINEETARDDTYNTAEIGIDLLANLTMNMGGLASDAENSPVDGWNMILFPYATGDFHTGTGEFRYTDKDGTEKILYHNGYINYTQTMQKVVELAGISDPEAVVVTGYSAGGFAAALLADDVFTNYFPNADSKTVLVDASLLLNDDWHNIATDVWKTPTAISDKLKSNNLTLDCLTALRERYGDNINLLFDSSTRDGDLAKVQNYLDTGVMDFTEKEADIYQQTLKDAILKFQEIGVCLFIWDGLPWYDDPRNMTAHTIIATPTVWLPFEEQKQSIAGWLGDAINGEPKDYGLDLVNKEYPSSGSETN